MLALAAVAIAIVVLVNVITSIYIYRAPAYEMRQKVSQTVVIWFLPLLGAAMCSYFLYCDRKAASRRTGSDVDSSITDQQAIAFGLASNHDANR